MKPTRITDIPSVQVSRPQPFFNKSTGRSFEIAAKTDVAEIDLYDEIGFWGVTAADFKGALNSITAKSITLRINSPGGDVFDGIAMFNDLVDHPADVEVEISGLAASAASIVAMAGDKITIAPNAFMMIHNAWALAVGDANDMTEMADILGKIDGSLAATYAARTGQSVKEMSALMDAETWLTADDAVEGGFADGTSAADAGAPAASFDLTPFQHPPRALCDAAPAAPATKRDFERALRDAGVSKSSAVAMVAGGFKSTQDRRDADERWPVEMRPLLERRYN